MEALVDKAYKSFSDKLNDALKVFDTITIINVQPGGGGGRDEVWDREMMFSQLAKRSPSVVVSG